MDRPRGLLSSVSIVTEEVVLSYLLCVFLESVCRFYHYSVNHGTCKYEKFTGDDLQRYKRNHTSSAPPARLKVRVGYLKAALLG